MQQKTADFRKNKLCCDLLLSLCCCLLYSNLFSRRFLITKDAFVSSQTDQQIQEINISLDYNFPRERLMSRYVPHSFNTLNLQW